MDDAPLAFIQRNKLIIFICEAVAIVFDESVAIFHRTINIFDPFCEDSE